VCDTFNCVHLFVFREIEQQQEKEVADLCELWNELRQKLLSVFHAAATQPSITCSASDPASASSVPNTDVDSVHELIERFGIVCTRHRKSCCKLLSSTLILKTSQPIKC